jgi:hypothetical protein
MPNKSASSVPKNTKVAMAASGKPEVKPPPLGSSQRSTKRGRASRGGGYRIARTTPTELLRHDISDEELGALGEMKRDHLWDFMWIVLGVALGSAPSACEHIWGLFHDHPISVKGLAEVVITFICAAAFAILYLAVYSYREVPTDLASAIRERTKQMVSGG